MHVGFRQLYVVLEIDLPMLRRQIQIKVFMMPGLSVAFVRLGLEQFGATRQQLFFSKRRPLRCITRVVYTAHLPTLVKAKDFSLTTTVTTLKSLATAVRR